jgi:hypothetical protein
MNLKAGKNDIRKVESKRDVKSLNENLAFLILIFNILTLYIFDKIKFS